MVFEEGSATHFVFRRIDGKWRIPQKVPITQKDKTIIVIASPRFFPSRKISLEIGISERKTNFLAITVYRRKIEFVFTEKVLRII